MDAKMIQDGLKEAIETPGSNVEVVDVSFESGIAKVSLHYRMKFEIDLVQLEGKPDDQVISVLASQVQHGISEVDDFMNSVEDAEG